MLDDTSGLYCGSHWTALVYMILFSLLEPFGSGYYQLGCFCVQVIETATQRGINDEELCYLTEKAVRGWEELGLLTHWLNDIIRTWCFSRFHPALIWLSSRSIHICRSPQSHIPTFLMSGRNKRGVAFYLSY